MLCDSGDIVDTNDFDVVVFNVATRCARDVVVIAASDVTVGVVPCLARRESPPVALAISVAVASCLSLLLYDALVKHP
jgi:hypothetical protein